MEQCAWQKLKSFRVSRKISVPARVAAKKSRTDFSSNSRELTAQQKPQEVTR